jgi:hypothetical protein
MIMAGWREEVSRDIIKGNARHQIMPSLVYKRSSIFFSYFRYAHIEN